MVPRSSPVLTYWLVAPDPEIALPIGPSILLKPPTIVASRLFPEWSSTVDPDSSSNRSQTYGLSARTSSAYVIHQSFLARVEQPARARADRFLSGSYLA